MKYWFHFLDSFKEPNFPSETCADQSHLLYLVTISQTAMTLCCIMINPNPKMWIKYIYFPYLGPDVTVEMKLMLSFKINSKKTKSSWSLLYEMLNKLTPTDFNMVWSQSGVSHYEVVAVSCQTAGLQNFVMFVSLTVEVCWVFFSSSQ